MIEISGNLGSNLHESIQGQKQDTVIFHKLSSDQTKRIHDENNQHPDWFLIKLNGPSR